MIDSKIKGIAKVLHQMGPEVIPVLKQKPLGRHEAYDGLYLYLGFKEDFKGEYIEGILDILTETNDETTFQAALRVLSLLPYRAHHKEPIVKAMNLIRKNGRVGPFHERFVDKIFKKVSSL